MQWTKPDFQEITLNMEVTAYVCTDDKERGAAEPVATARPHAPAALADG